MLVCSWIVPSLSPVSHLSIVYSCCLTRPRASSRCEKGAGLPREGSKKVAREVLLDISWYGPAEARINSLYTGILLVRYCHRFGVDQEENH
jgi:hypothetical protein